MNAVTFLSNAGVVLALGGVSLMVDGIYNAGGLPFSDVPGDILAAVRPDYLAFTHTHHDHLDQGRLEAYLAVRLVQGLLLPPGVRADRHGAPGVVMKGTGGTVAWRGLTVRWARTPHLDHAKPEHHSFVVAGGGAAVLVAGDAMPSPQLAALCAGERLDAALLTPFFLQDPEGRRLLETIGVPDQVLLYHLPRVEDDAHNLLRLAQRQVERWGGLFHLTPLVESGQQIALA